MTSLEDRYGSIRLDVLIHTCRSRASDDPLLTVIALRASWHLARMWPAPGFAASSSRTVGTTLLAVKRCSVDRIWLLG